MTANEVKEDKFVVNLETIQAEIIDIRAKLRVVMDSQAQIIAKLENREFKDVRDKMDEQAEEYIVDIINAKIDASK